MLIFKEATAHKPGDATTMMEFATSHPNGPLSPMVQAGLPVSPQGNRAAAPTMQRTREMTLDELLLENRVIFLVGDINYSTASRVMMQMLYLEDQKRNQTINFYINSHGGAVDDTLAIYDTMRFISSDIATYCIGRATPVPPCFSQPVQRDTGTSCRMPRS